MLKKEKSGRVPCVQDEWYEAFAMAHSMNDVMTANTVVRTVNDSQPDVLGRSHVTYDDMVEELKHLEWKKDASSEIAYEKWHEKARDDCGLTYRKGNERIRRIVLVVDVWDGEKEPMEWPWKRLLDGAAKVVVESITNVDTGEAMMEEEVRGVKMSEMNCVIDLGNGCAVSLSRQQDDTVEVKVARAGKLIGTVLAEKA